MNRTSWSIPTAPFSTPAGAAALLAGPAQSEALARLEFLRETRGRLGLLLGPAGSGKSPVLAEFARRSTRSGHVVAAISALGLDDQALLAQLADHLGTQAGDKHAWLTLLDRLNELALESRSAVLILDDLDRAESSALTVVERLLAIHHAPLTIIASARPQSLARMGPSLLSHVALRIDLLPWSVEETKAYLESTLHAVEGAQAAFDATAVRRLTELSAGAPRRINHLAQLALLAGTGQQLSRITAETIDAVEEELSLGVRVS